MLESSEREDPEGLVQGLADPDAWVRSVAYMFVTSFPAEKFQQVPHSLRARAAHWVLQDIGEGEYDEDCEQAIKTLALLGDQQAVKPLLDLFDSADESLCQDILWSLGILGSNSKDQATRQRLADKMISVLEGSPEICQFKAAEALGRLGDPRALQVLPEAIRRTADDEDSLVAYYAADGLGRIGSAALPTVRDLLADPNPAVRQAAVWALAGLLDYPSDQKLRDRVKKSLEKAAKDSDESVRSSAESALRSHY